jgi:(E)-4-hydroxy-3-methylbut-2-enyl-diphosphate synthase
MAVLSQTHGGPTFRRRPTRTVRVGDVAVGSDHPIRVQSMTTPATTDTAATVAQIERLVAAGCEIVRLTVPTSADAGALPAIRSELARRRIRVPLVADIHFTPAAALQAVEHVEKIRINPGNYADKKKFAVREYTDSEYAAELERIERVFSPLVRRARELGVSMRIGTNHGSLSDRIMNRYGDTPEGMVESALEFVRICERHGYRDLILSMKSSNPRVVVQAYRLLVASMAAEGMDYPLHLGVTEAGDGEDGRIKSAVGIGTLLDEGLGDTVRVSLTEDPVKEIPVARALVEPYNRRIEAPPPGATHLRSSAADASQPRAFDRRASETVQVGPHTVGGGRTVLVEVPLLASPSDEAAVRSAIDAQAGVRVPQEARAEVVSVSCRDPRDLEAVARLRLALELVAPRVALSCRLEDRWLRENGEATWRPWLAAAHRLHVRLEAPVAPDVIDRIGRLVSLAAADGRSVLVETHARGALDAAVDLALAVAEREPRGGPHGLLLALTPTAERSPLVAVRQLVARLDAVGRRTPLVLLDDPGLRDAHPLLGPAAALGGLLCDGIGDAVHVVAADGASSRRIAFGILQAARVRITRTEFISCPSCGRTLFDLEETTARIKRRTAHLKGLKIAVMGCIVNGPGEMADADFGYVGWGEDKIALFVGKDMVARDIPTAEADERLVQLIKDHGRWIDPPPCASEEIEPTFRA